MSNDYGFKNVITRNFMSGVKSGYMTEDEINSELNEIISKVEALRVEAINKLKKINTCNHEFGKARGQTQLMILGDARDSWSRECIHCGMGESFSCMQESSVPRPEWTNGVKLTFIPRM